MRNKKLLFILIPVLVVVLGLIAGIVFVALNSSPEKIFENSISKVFDMFETSEEQFSTMKGTMNLTASVDSNSEELQAVNDILDGSSIGLSMEVDTKNMVINENLNVTVNNESLLNASVLLHDQKGYLYLPDWLDKYLQIPEEELDYTELTKSYNKTATLDQNALMEAIKEELIEAVLAQELIQEKTTLVLDGQETKVIASTLSLKGAAILSFTNGFLTNLKANEKFQLALGDYKEDVILMLDEMLTALDSNTSQDIESDDEFRLVIYTKGFLNEFVGLSAKVIDTYYGDTTGFELLKNSDEKYEFKAYNEYEGEREDAFNITVENKKESKNKGTATITMTVEEEQFVVTYNYETQGKQTFFELSTEIEGVGLSLSGNAVEDEKNVKGNFVISVQEETIGKANLNCAYDFTYDVEVQKVNVGNAVLIDELSEEDQEKFMKNLENSAAYGFISAISENLALNSVVDNAFQNTQNVNNQMPMVTYDEYTVMYTVPEGFELSEYSSEDYKMYMDENLNSINVSINYDSVDAYMRDLDDEYVLTSDFYENQKISETKTYDVNGKEYKFRTITYNDEFGSYVEIYFAYELDDEYCYTVEVETEGGISMEIIKNFLDVTVNQAGLMPTDDIASTGEEIIDILQ